MASENNDTVKVSLPRFLKALTSGNIPMSKAMAFAGKVYKSYNTTESIVALTDAKLKAAGIDAQEDRKMVLAALRKAGYKPNPSSQVGRVKVALSPSTSDTDSSKTVLSPSLEAQITPTKRKRKRSSLDVNEFLPTEPVDMQDSEESFDFGEVLDEEALKHKSVIINRAPVMMAWAMAVAERLHFSRAEALSIASVYTEMNAVTKGVSLGLYQKDTERGAEAPKDGAQPYVELIGRRPLYKTQSGQWRALSNGIPSHPSSAFSYLSRSFRQTTPNIIGAMRLLAESYDEKELNNRAWSLYADFRPSVNEWGKRSEVRCDVILALRKQKSELVSHDADTKFKVPKIEMEDALALAAKDEAPPTKKPKMTLEEYEAFLDQDSTFDNVDLNF
ncbi:hypothetical protein BJ165DRAFT_1411820 [Panaeolus papilionaceus]|nr:hypothetical protein BJ165DRAFT_1411820 [Panaeolus papilionaceus]